MFFKQIIFTHLSSLMQKLLRCMYLYHVCIYSVPETLFSIFIYCTFIYYFSPSHGEMVTTPFSTSMNSLPCLMVMLRMRVIFPSQKWCCQPSARTDGTRKRKTSNKRNNTFIKKQLKYYSCRNQLKKYNPKFVKRKTRFFVN